MHAGQYKRIYNVVFVVLALCSFVFAFRVPKDLIADAIYQAHESQRQQSMAFSQRPSYDDMVKEGKVEEAKKGEKDAIKYYAVERRIRFCEDNLGLLATIATLLAYTASYFLFWFIITLTVRYVRKAPTISLL